MQHYNNNEITDTMKQHRTHKHTNRDRLTDANAIQKTRNIDKRGEHNEQKVRPKHENAHKRQTNQ